MNRLAPALLAARLATAPVTVQNPAAKEAVLDRVTSLWWDELVSVTDHIGRNPEVGFQEYAAEDTPT